MTDAKGETRGWISRVSYWEVIPTNADKQRSWDAPSSVSSGFLPVHVLAGEGP